MEIFHPTDEITYITEARKNMYTKLATSFTYPEGELVEDMARADWALAESVHGSAEDILQSMQIEYTRLFITTAYESLLAPPYESYYRHEKSLLMHPETIMDLNNLLHQAGLDLVDDCDLAPDHIAVELEIMSYLVEAEQECRRNNDETELVLILGLQKKLIEDHLNIWLVPFFERILLHTQHPFYKNLGETGRSFLQTEVEYLKSIDCTN